jgi:putative ABC transport system permease protein
LKPFTLHISLYDAAFFGMIAISLTFILLLAFSRGTNKAANRFLAMAMGVAMLWVTRLLATDLGLPGYIPLPLFLAFGPLLFFYVVKVTRAESQFKRRDLWHFSPLLLLPLTGSLMNAVQASLVFISITSYLYGSHRQIARSGGGCIAY